MKLRAKGKLLVAATLVLIVCFVLVLCYYRFFYLHHVAKEVNLLISQGSPVTQQQLVAISAGNEMLFLSGFSLGAAMLLMLLLVWRFLLVPLYKQMNDMSYRLEDTKRIKTQMITAVTHDLRTPLTSICGYVERLLDGKVRTEERKAEYYRIIYKKAKDIENIISDFTEFVKHENTLVFTRERILLKPFIQSLVDEYQEEFHFSGSHLKLRYDLKDDAKLCINEQLMRRVFVNLFSNALKHNDQPIEVTVRCYADREHIAITIEDTGKAVPADELPRIFERFYCVDKSRSRERGGSGLGLTICERIIDLHQGTIVAYLVPEGGLGFKIKLLRDSTK